MPPASLRKVLCTTSTEPPKLRTSGLAGAPCKRRRPSIDATTSTPSRRSEPWTTASPRAASTLRCVAWLVGVGPPATKGRDGSPTGRPCTMLSSASGLPPPLNMPLTVIVRLRQTGSSIAVGFSYPPPAVSSITRMSSRVTAAARSAPSVNRMCPGASGGGGAGGCDGAVEGGGRCGESWVPPPQAQQRALASQPSSDAERPHQFRWFQ